MKFFPYLIIIFLVTLLHPFSGNAQLRQIPNFPLLNEEYSITSTAEVDKGIVFLNILNEHIWFSDGTAEGTLPLLQTCDPSQEEIITDMKAASGKVYFSCESVVYATDGSPSGTQNIFASHVYPHNYESSDSSCYFLAAPGASPILIRTNGTASGTKQIPLQVKTPQIPFYSQLDLLAYKGWLYYIFGYGSYNAETEIRLHRINPKDSATEDLITLGYHTQIPAKTAVLLNSSAVVNDLLLVGDFNDTLLRFRLWKSEGAVNDFTILKELTGIKGIPTLYPIQDHVLFQAVGQLWSTDGTADGTLPLRTGTYSIYTSATQTYLYGSDGLWLTDGTVGNTVSVYSGGGSITNPVSAGNLVFFRVTSNGVNSIWRTDGTPGGTFLVKDNFTGSYYACGNLLFFTYKDGATGNELWVSDGSITGTYEAKDFNPGSGSSNPAFLFNIKNRFYFTVNVPVTDSTGAAAGMVEQAWVYDPLVTGIQTGNSNALHHVLFPNPASKYIQVSQEITGGRIINTLGGVVGAYAPGSGVLDVSPLPEGMYFFVYENAAGVRMSEKFQVAK